MLTLFFIVRLTYPIAGNGKMEAVQFATLNEACSEAEATKTNPTQAVYRVKFGDEMDVQRVFCKHIEATPAHFEADYTNNPAIINMRRNSHE